MLFLLPLPSMYKHAANQKKSDVSQGMYFHVTDYQCHCSTIPVVVVGTSLPVGPLAWYFIYTDGISVCVIIFHMKT
jgi:hypothetical protein